jgi:hypothetical protein
VAEDRRDSCWFHILTNWSTKPHRQEPIKHPTRFEWHEVTKVAHSCPSMDALTKPMEVREEHAPEGVIVKSD